MMAVSVFFVRIVIPKVRGILLRVPNISGEWESNEKTDDGKEVKRKLIVQQYGIRVKAKVTREHYKKRVFYYQGTFQAGQLVLHFEEKGGEGYIVGAMVLKLSSSREDLNGKAVYFHHNSGEVVCSDRWYKKC
ncbi:MAG: hypothetical protein U9N47_06515 [Thermodesulfobacteriota bacterium]|nr:hypothetical protein [Thermodesulfobacteriota bacterium]